MAAAEQLEKLRDIHLPQPPGWWPPAPGWWLLGLLAVLGCGWLLWWWRRRRQGLRPLRHGQRLYADVYQRYRAGELSDREYLDASNELLKRILIHGLGERAARRASGQRWLELLDHHLGEPAFSRGPGQLLGNDRFRPAQIGGAEQLHPLIEQLLGRLSPPGAAERAS